MRKKKRRKEKDYSSLCFSLKKNKNEIYKLN